MGAKSYILMALPIVFLVGFLALFIWIGRRRPLRFTALADKLGLQPRDAAGGRDGAYDPIQSNLYCIHGYAVWFAGMYPLQRIC